MEPTLLILAAGLGTRYGGLKQIDPVGPHGEWLLDYSIYDALAAGFGKLVFVIRHYFEDAFRETFAGRFGNRAPVGYAYQEVEVCTQGFEPPAGRDKPWGTAHAVLVAEAMIDEPFAVINADDYYGARSLAAMAEFLRGPEVSPARYAMVGFRLGNTLSEYGAVSRGICRCGPDGLLTEVCELRVTSCELNNAPPPTHNSQLATRNAQPSTRSAQRRKRGSGACYLDSSGVEHALTGDEPVSMNLWGFHPSIFGHLAGQFSCFLKERGCEGGSELFLPAAVDRLIRNGPATVRVLATDDTWFGITYRPDAEAARRHITRLVDQGRYPRRLWA